MLNLFGVAFKVPTMANPYEEVVLSLPTFVIDRLLHIFLQCIVTRYYVSGNFCMQNFLFPFYELSILD